MSPRATVRLGLILFGVLATTLLSLVALELGRVHSPSAMPTWGIVVAVVVIILCAALPYDKEP